MSDFEEMPIEPEFSGNFFNQIFQNMKLYTPLDLLELYLDIVILVLIVMAAIALGVNKAYKNWDKIKTITTHTKAKITGSKKRAN